MKLFKRSAGAVSAAVTAPLPRAPGSEDELPAVPSEPDDIAVLAVDDTVESGDEVVPEGDAETDTEEEGDEAEEPEEPEGPPVVEYEPSELDSALTVRLAQMIKSNYDRERRDLAVPNGQLLGRLLRDCPHAKVWVVGHVAKPKGWGYLAWADRSRDGYFFAITPPGDRDATRTLDALQEAVQAAATEAGLTALVSTVDIDGVLEQFCLSHGWAEVPDSQFVIRRLELTKTAERRHRIVEDTESYASNYTLERVKAPYGDGEEEVPGLTWWKVEARVPVVGTVVGQSDVKIWDDMSEYALAGQTYVDENHLGHRLGLLMKAEMMAWVQKDRPKVRIFQSSTSVSDTFMLSIHDRLGARGAGVTKDVRLSL